MLTVVCLLRFTLCVCVQCWCWPDGDLLCVEYSPGEGEGRGHPGCLSDSEEPPTAETPHGADTGEEQLGKRINTFPKMLNYNFKKLV